MFYKTYLQNLIDCQAPQKGIMIKKQRFQSFIWMKRRAATITHIKLKGSEPYCNWCNIGSYHIQGPLIIKRRCKNSRNSDNVVSRAAARQQRALSRALQFAQSLLLLCRVLFGSLKFAKDDAYYICRIRDGLQGLP